MNEREERVRFENGKYTKWRSHSHRYVIIVAADSVARTPARSSIPLQCARWAIFRANANAPPHTHRMMIRIVQPISLTAHGVRFGVWGCEIVNTTTFAGESHMKCNKQERNPQGHIYHRITASTAVEKILPPFISHSGSQAWQPATSTGMGISYLWHIT